jgi:hypothetical protein
MLRGPGSRLVSWHGADSIKTRINQPISTFFTDYLASKGRKSASLGR